MGSIFLLLLSLICTMNQPCFASNSSVLCRPEDSQSLLQLKQHLSPSGGKGGWYCTSESSRDYLPMSWNESSDCCRWEGITCDEHSGDVIGLDLSCGGVSGTIESNSTLFHLNHLRKLNLSGNYFDGSEISFRFGHLTSLAYLSLAGSGFKGRIPQEFYHLSNLVHLDLTSRAPRFQVEPLECDIKSLFSNMTRLRVLWLGQVKIASDLSVISNMSSFLTSLDLSSTQLYGDLPQGLFGQLPFLQILKLNDNPGLTGPLPVLLNQSIIGGYYPLERLEVVGTSLQGQLPDSIGLFTSMRYMDLSFCKFSGSIPESIGNLTEIEEMRLGSNRFSGRLPSTISILEKLTYLDVSNNHVDGEIPDAFHKLQNIKTLVLRNNSFDGRIPSSIANLSQIVFLDLSSNALTSLPPSGMGPQNVSYVDFSENLIEGTIPFWLLNLSSAESLFLNSNNLGGEIVTKFQCRQITELNLNGNRLTIDLSVFSDLTELRYLDISHNTILTNPSDQINTNATFPFLLTLGMSSCEITDLPAHFLSNLSSLFTLDLSHNEIHGQIPEWFSSMPSKDLVHLDLSFNYLTHVGDLPWSDLWFLNFESNSIQGSIPSSVSNMSFLSVLNLLDNEFSGAIPSWVGNISNSLRILDLRRNKFSGKIPEIIGGEESSLKSLGLNGNYLDGPLPQSLANCTGLEVLDVGNNMIRDSFPWWLEMLPQLRILILKSNRFYGSIISPSRNDSFAKLRIIDLSNNRFSGHVPEKLFVNMKALKGLNNTEIDDFTDTSSLDDDVNNRLYMGDENYQLSVTLQVKGGDTEISSILRIFTTIDLSNNNFSGQIPESLGNLTSLRLLNLSHNSISGNIPPSLGHMLKLEQLDLSWNQLTAGIPNALTSLTSLAVLNLSQNHLVGRIPNDKQFSTFSNDSYIGNMGLCGSPLTRDCDPKSTMPPQSSDEDGFASSFINGFTWEAVVMGYGCGIVVGFTVGNFMFFLGKPKWFVRLVPVEIFLWL